jgi:hypothetical protein
MWAEDEWDLGLGGESAAEERLDRTHGIEQLALLRIRQWRQDAGHSVSRSGIEFCKRRATFRGQLEMVLARVD